MSEQNVAVVTGASRGIGAAIAGGLAADGYHVVGTATADKGLAAVGDTLADSEHTALALNLMDETSIDTFMDQLGERGLQPNLLVNNAGITRDNLLLRMKNDEWDDVIAANLTGVFKLTKRLVREMLKKRYGRIVNITSVVGASGNAGQTNYAAAKAGIIGFTKSLAQEVAGRGVTVNAIAPGFIDTDMTRALSDEQRETLLARIPVNRLGTGTDIAAAVSFLASDGAAYITGETIHVNGGMYMS